LEDQKTTINTEIQMDEADFLEIDKAVNDCNMKKKYEDI